MTGVYELKVGCKAMGALIVHMMVTEWIEWIPEKFKYERSINEMRDGIAPISLLVLFGVSTPPSEPHAPGLQKGVRLIDARRALSIRPAGHHHPCSETYLRVSDTNMIHKLVVPEKVLAAGILTDTGGASVTLSTRVMLVTMTMEISGPVKVCLTDWAREACRVSWIAGRYQRRVWHRGDLIIR